MRYHGDAQEGDRSEAGAIAGEVVDEIAEVSIVDDTGRTYLVSPDKVRGRAYGQVGRRSESGRLLWIPDGDFLAVPASGGAGSGTGRPVVRWLEFSTGSGQGEGTGPVRLEIRPPAAVPIGTTEPVWPTPAEAYLAELAPVYHWSLSSFETGSVDLDAPEIVAAAAGALLAVGALPNGAGLAVPLPLQQAIAVVENISAYEDLRAHDGTGSFWFWPPVPTQAKQLRVIVSTRWEAAWALIDIPGR